MSLLSKIKALPEQKITDDDTLDKLNKLINITRTSQWELLNLDSEDADDLYQELHKINSNINRLEKIQNRIANASHEHIPLVFDGEDFI